MLKGIGEMRREALSGSTAEVAQEGERRPDGESGRTAAKERSDPTSTTERAPKGLDHNLGL